MDGVVMIDHWSSVSTFSANNVITNKVFIRWDLKVEGRRGGWAEGL